MEGECHESGRVLMYQWKFKDLTERCSIMTEMAEFLGLKAFRFALKKVGGQDTKTRLYFICTNLHKIGYKVVKVSVKIKGKPDLDGHMNLCENELDHLQLFVKEIDCEWQKQETFTFGVHVIETLENYRYQLSDILFTDQLWLTAKNKLWTDIEFSVQNHIFSAHRAILAARSPTLFGSIESPIVGSRIKIDHTEPLVFEMFLRFLYTGVFQVNNHRSVNEELLKLAERYKLSTLKSLCQLAVQDIDANQLTSFAMAMKPDFEICPKKPQLK
jgi:hypothetical protein